MISIKQRLKLAWMVLNLKEFEIVIEPYQKVARLKSGSECDNHWEWRTGCANKETVCMSRTIAVFRIDRDDHAHVCDSCAAKLEGSIEEL